MAEIMRAVGIPCQRDRNPPDKPRRGECAEPAVPGESELVSFALPRELDPRYPAPYLVALAYPLPHVLLVPYDYGAARFRPLDNGRVQHVIRPAALPRPLGAAQVAPDEHVVPLRGEAAPRRRIGRGHEDVQHVPLEHPHDLSAGEGILGRRSRQPDISYLGLRASPPG